MHTTDSADVLWFDVASGDDREQMEQGSHYDYRSQRWVDGHDHAHYLTDSGPLMFCGADVVTCQGELAVAEHGSDR